MRAFVVRIGIVLGVVGGGVALSGCDFASSLTSPSEPSSPTGPSPLLLGNWVSEPNTLAGAEACSNLQWQITEIVGVTATGTFSATCAGAVQLQGTGSATLKDGTSLDWSATGVATVPGGTSCDFALTGTAVPEVDRIAVTYTGTTCLGPVSGTEYLRRS